MAEFCQIPLLPISRELGCKSVLVVTDAGVSKLGLTQPLLEGAQRAGLRVTVYDEVWLKSLTWRRNFNLDTLSVGHRGPAREGCTGPHQSGQGAIILSIYFSIDP